MRACSPKPNKKEWILHCCSASHIFSGVTEHHDRSSRKLLAPICNQHAFTHILIRERSAHTLRDILLTSTINYFSCGGGKQMLTKLLTGTHPTNNWACHLESLGARAPTVPCSDRCLSALWGQLWASSTTPALGAACPCAAHSAVTTAMTTLWSSDRCTGELTACMELSHETFTGLQQRTSAFTPGGRTMDPNYVQSWSTNPSI